MLLVIPNHLRMDTIIIMMAKMIWSAHVQLCAWMATQMPRGSC